MGGRSKSKSSSAPKVNTAQLQSQGAAQQAAQMQGAANIEQKMFSEMLGSAFPAFGELIQTGLNRMDSNPFGQLALGMMGMPIRMQTPEVMQSFINKYRPQQPVEPVVQPPQPQVQNHNRGMFGGRGFM